MGTCSAPSAYPASRGTLAVALLLLALAVVLPAAAGAPTVTECLEGSDFIANAAQSRDNGMPRAVFIARMEEDFAMVRAFPPALRWFTHDPDDERFLLESAQRVFDVPVEPERHRARFLAECLDRVTVRALLTL